jgi:L-cysteate sulfo-lyase
VTETTITRTGRARLAEALARFPKLRLAHLPTPIEPMDRLSETLGGPRFWVKRDDCTGLATGGNKARKLDYLMAAAREAGATAIVTQGATQSNHTRQTAAAAAKLGMACHILLEDRTGSADFAYNASGNVLLSRMVGGTLTKFPGGTDMAAEMERVAAGLKARGETPFVIPGGGSNEIGALGYAECAHELAGQAAEAGVTFDMIVQPTGSAGTHAGMVAGLHVMDDRTPLLGIGTRAPRSRQEAMVRALAERTLAELGHDVPLPAERVQANCDYVGDGYGVPTAGMVEAVGLLARLEGLLFDPVYSGKALAGLIDLAHRGFFDGMRNVVFLHTGGASAIFAYPGTFDAAPA